LTNCISLKTKCLAEIQMASFRQLSNPRTKSRAASTEEAPDDVGTACCEEVLSEVLVFSPGPPVQGRSTIAIFPDPISPSQNLKEKQGASIWKLGTLGRMSHKTRHSPKNTIS
jgi:hypothetical protein